MQVIRVRLKLGSINMILRAAQPQVDKVGRAMAADAGDGFAYEGRKPHRWTARGFVQTSSAAGARRQAKHAVLERVTATRRS